MPKNNPIKRVFDLYTSDLKFEEIERLIKKESASIYEFYKNEIPKPNINQNKFIRGLIFLRSLFNAFLLKLPAARRIFYLIGMFLFAIGYFKESWTYIIVSFFLVNVLLAFELAEKLVMKDELEIAKKIQEGLMPQECPKSDNYDIAAHCESAKEVGGDYLDFIKSENGIKRNYIVIGDISGKGMAAALYMVRVQAITNFLARNYNDVKEIVLNLKKHFSERLRKEYFLTLLAASIEENGDLTVCRAGHMPVLMFSNKTKEFSTINPQGIGIGLNDKGIFEKTLETTSVSPEEGDILFFYTDGVTESMNEMRRQFGIERVKKIIEKNHQETAEVIKEKLLRRINIFRGEELPNDDITFIILKSKNNHS